MDSEEPPNVRVACSGDIDEVVRLMHDAAAWMSAKGTPAWDVARIDRTFAETFVLRSELLVASCSDGIVGCCTLSAEDPEFWPDALKGEAAYLHKLAVRRTHAGRGVSSALIEACRHAGVVCGRGRNPTLRLWPAIFSGEIDVFPSERRNMGQEIGR
ncbi:GNAT family N-acetyltransferase [Pantoea anthophila]|nr:GNAT family N-acetyltransferase [Pantoea anthophila]